MREALCRRVLEIDHVDDTEDGIARRMWPLIDHVLQSTRYISLSEI